MLTTVRLCGLAVRSEIPLHQTRFDAGGRVDLEIIAGADMAEARCVPPGRVMLDLRANRQYYTAAATPTGYHLRFYGTCDVVLTTDLTHARVHRVDGADPALVSILLAGTLLAFVLAMRGEAVLHASAVETSAGALAFVGASGMGKSTMATLMCASGARAITDDLLRLDLTARQPRCALGATELRLREGAVRLVSHFDDRPGCRRTADARHAIAVPTSDTEDCPLAAIVVPLPDRSPVGTPDRSPDRAPERTDARIEQLDRKAAFLLLSRFPRLLGWRDEDVLRRQFQHLGEIVDRVPVFLGVLPWGPPFRTDLAEDVLRAVGAHQPGASSDLVSSAGSNGS